MASSRPIDRDVLFYDLRDPSTLLGGLYLTRGITNANFHAMVEIVVLFDAPFSIQNDNRRTVPRNERPLQPGNYFIATSGTLELNNENRRYRTMTQSAGRRIEEFKREVRNRDRHCVISKMPNRGAARNDWYGFKAAHIFPLAYERLWEGENMGRWITIPPSAEEGAINSVQNGLLLSSTIHQLFDHYRISINPDDGYKIVSFDEDSAFVSGGSLDRQLLDDPRRPVDGVLRWHFRQAVLANMKAAAEPSFDHDFPPGSDMMGEIMNGAMAAERMEFELFSRFLVNRELAEIEPEGV